MSAFDGMVGIIVPAAVTGVAGYGLSVWRSRALPWISITEFGQASASSDVVTISDSFSKSTESSWYMENLLPGQRRLGDVATAYSVAKNWINSNSLAMSTLSTGIEKLRNSNSNDEITSAIRSVIRVTSISDLLDLALWRSKITPAPFDFERSQTLTFALNNDRYQGCYSLYLEDSIIYFGESFQSHGNRADKLRPFMELVSRLEKDKVLAVFEQLVPIWKDQNDHHKAILEEGEEIMQSYSRWTAYFVITNFGSTPVVVFPEKSVLIVRSKNARTFRLPCDIAKKDEDGNTVPAKGVILVQTGHTDGLMLVTKQTQNEIDGGGVLRSVFEAGDSEAQLEVRFTGRDFPWKRRATSELLRFEQ